MTHQETASARLRWVCVVASMLQHPVLDREPYSYRDAWLWLIINAAWKTHRVWINGIFVTIERGQVVVGLDHLALTWRWSVKRVRNSLARLEAEGMLKKGKSAGRIACVATICNYEKYQNAPDRKNKFEEGFREGSGQVEGNTAQGDINNTNSPSPCGEAEISIKGSRVEIGPSVRAELEREFPNCDVDRAVVAAAPECLRFRHPSQDDLLAVIRKSIALQRRAPARSSGDDWYRKYKASRGGGE